MVNYRGVEFNVKNGEYYFYGSKVLNINGKNVKDFMNKKEGEILEIDVLENGRKRRIKLENKVGLSCAAAEVEKEDDKSLERKDTMEVVSKVKHVDIESSAGGETETEEIENQINLGINFKDWKEYCEYRRDTHQMSSVYYNKRNMYFVVPSILLTSISGILSFFASSDNISTEDGSKINMVVGTLAGMSGLIQSFSSTFKYSNKAEAHQIAMESFDVLLNRIRFRIARGFESNEKDKDFLKNIETEIIEIKHRCKNLVPDQIEKAYLDRNFRYLRNKELFTLKKKYIESKCEDLKSTLNIKDIKIFENSTETHFNAV